jgi:hypothetical protein
MAMMQRLRLKPSEGSRVITNALSEQENLSRSGEREWPGGGGRLVTDKRHGGPPLLELSSGNERGRIGADVAADHY